MSSSLARFVSILTLVGAVPSLGCAAPASDLEEMGEVSNEQVAGKKLPSFATLLANFPATETPAEIRKIIGGSVDNDVYQNTCVIKMSHALNLSGPAFRITKGAGMVTEAGGPAFPFRYALRVKEFIPFLKRTYGAPTVSVTVAKDLSESEKMQAFLDAGGANTSGIIVFSVSIWSDASGHADLWDASTQTVADHGRFAEADKIELWPASN